MQVQLTHPITWLRGTYSQDTPVFYVRNGKTFGRRRFTPRLPDTVELRSVQDIWRRAKKAREMQSMEQRVAWEGYAIKLGRVKNSPARAAHNEFCAVNFWRMAMGFEPRLDPPAAKPVRSATRILQATASAADEFVFRVEHGIADIENYRLVVEVTRAMPSVRRKPQENEFVWIKGPDGSVVNLQASEVVYRISGSRRSVADGQRYGLRVRIVRTDGVAGKQVQTDFIKTVDALPEQIARERAAAEIAAKAQLKREAKLRRHNRRHGDHWPLKFSHSLRHLRYEDTLPRSRRKEFLISEGWLDPPAAGGAGGKT